MDEILLLLITVIPSLLLCLIIYLFDKEKENSRIIIKLFMSGVLSVILVLIITILFSSFFPSLVINTNQIQNISFIKLLLYTTLSIGLIEEGSKWIFTYLFVVKDEEFNQAFDAVVYAVIVSLGFAMFENVSYVLSSGKELALLRSVTAIPAHFSFALFMGYFIGKARYLKENNNKYKLYLLLSIVAPVMLHSIYDYIALTYNSIGVLYIYIILSLCFGVYLSFRLRRYSNLVRPLKDKY